MTSGVAPAGRNAKKPDKISSICHIQNEYTGVQFVDSCIQFTINVLFYCKGRARSCFSRGRGAKPDMTCDFAIAVMQQGVATRQGHVHAATRTVTDARIAARLWAGKT